MYRGLEAHKTSYKEVLIGLRKANHDSAGSLVRYVSSEEGTGEGSPKCPAEGDCHTANMAARERVVQGVMKMTTVFVMIWEPNWHV